MSTKGKKLPPRSKEIEISFNAEQLILGSILGDGTVSKNRRLEDSTLNLNSKISIKHSIDQEEYVFHKQRLFENENIKTHLSYRNPPEISHYIQNREVKGKVSIVLDTLKNISFNKYRNLFYTDRKNIIDYLYKLEALGLAIWFMDDGSKNISGYYLHTNSFTHEEHLILQDILYKNFNLETSIHKSKDKYILYIKRNSVKKFNQLVIPFICDSMIYKLHWQ